MDNHTTAAPYGLVFGRRGTVGGSTIAVNISSFAASSLAARSLFNSCNFFEDGHRNSIGLGLDLKDANNQKSSADFRSEEDWQ